MKGALYEQASGQLVSYLHANGLRNTQERLVLLQQICSYSGRFTAEQLEADILAERHISLATVYNALTLFRKCHIIRKLTSKQDARTSEYELVYGSDNTLRFVCSRCGREIDFKSRPIETILKEKKFSNFTMNHFALMVYGTCKRCRRPC